MDAGRALIRDTMRRAAAEEEPNVGTVGIAVGEAIMGHLDERRLSGRRRRLVEEKLRGLARQEFELMTAGMEAK